MAGEREASAGDFCCWARTAILRELCRRKIVDAYVPPGVREWGVTRYSAADDSLSAILGQAQTLPMLAPQQVIVVSRCLIAGSAWAMIRAMRW